MQPDHAAHRRSRWSHPAACVRAVCAARAALTIEIVGAGANQIPDRDRAVPRRGGPAAEAHAGGRGRPRAQRPVQDGRCRRRDAGAVRAARGELSATGRRAAPRRWSIGIVAQTCRRPLRGALPADRCGQADAARRLRVLRVGAAQLRATAHKIADVIYEKLTGDPGVFARASPTSSSAASATSCRSPTPTATARRPCSPRTSRSSRRPGRPTAAGSPTSRSSSSKPIVYVQSLATRHTAAWWRTSGAATARRRGRRTASGSRWC